MELKVTMNEELRQVITNYIFDKFGRAVDNVKISMTTKFIGDQRDGSYVPVFKQIEATLS